MEVLRVVQLDQHGNPFRHFDYHVNRDEIGAKLDQIRLAFNMERTRVLLNGDVLLEPQSHGTEQS